MNWSVYIILCTDGSLYTGISTDVERRFRQHQAGKGAKYFRGRQPLAIAYREEGYTRTSAGRRENTIKKLSRTEKQSLISSCESQSNPPAPDNGGYPKGVEAT